ncbi:hypothetical protein AB0C98_19750 [Streptomyces sp. NPDC048558]|uniref:hypothetical protein n=1 Tax=Streptomyces sp. NPDC048558 TaxID=3155759 RepID=UPI003447857D
MRARARFEAAPTQQAWWHRIDWTRWGTAVGVVAGIGTLLFTGIATYYGAMVSSDQLEQSREDSERETREQASQVSYWVEEEGPDTHIHLMNRSPDPVYDVWASVTVNLRTFIFSGSGPTNRVGIVIALDGLGPCMELVVETDSLEYWIDRNEGWRPLPGGIFSVHVAHLHFRDRDAIKWVRTDDKLTEFRPSEMSAGDTYLERNGRVKGAPSTKRTASCGTVANSA